LYWHTAPLGADLDVAGDIELQLSATSTAMDTAWIVMLRDIAPDGTITNITGGWLRASLREIDPDASRTGAPVLPCRNPQAVPIGEPVNYRIPLVPNARRFAAGHRIQLMITSDDQPKDIPVFLGYRHSPVGTTARNTIHATSRLKVPVLPTHH
jgi:predicted acyl esterase